MLSGHHDDGLSTTTGLYELSCDEIIERRRRNELPSLRPWRGKTNGVSLCRFSLLEVYRLCHFTLFFTAGASINGF